MITSRHCKRKSEDEAIILVWSILFVVLFVSIALGGLLPVRRLVPLPILESANAVTQITYGVTYVLYGITLASSLYPKNQDFSEARQTVEREAWDRSSRSPGSFRNPNRGRIQELAGSYARVEEWPLMAEGSESLQRSRAAEIADDLQTSVVGFEPDTDAEQTLYSQALTLVSDVEAEREIRLLHSQQDSHKLLWYVLVTGA